MLAVTVPQASEAVLVQAELVGVFAGLAVAAVARISGIPHLRRRGRVVSLSAGRQWGLLPPPNAPAADAQIAGVVEAAGAGCRRA